MNESTNFGLKTTGDNDQWRNTLDYHNENMGVIDAVMANNQNALGIIVDGNKAAVSATTGQYIILRNSTITGKTDGLYTAAKSIPANTAIDGTYLTAVSGGGLNALNSKIAPVIGTNKDWLTGKNLNDYKTTGIYYFSTSNTNNPPSIGWFTLIVIGGKSDVITQIAHAQNGGYYIREYRSAAWSNWYKYALESTVDSLNNTVGNLSNTVDSLNNTVGNLSNTVDSLNNNLIKFTTHTVTMNFSTGNAGSRIGYDDGALPTGVTANNIIGIVCTSYSWSTNTAQPPVTFVNSSNDHISVYVFASTNTSTSSGNTATFRIAYKGV